MKIEQLKKDSHAAIHGYDPNLKIQIRFDGKINLHHNDEVTKFLGNCQRDVKRMLFCGRAQEQQLMILLVDPSTFDFESTNGFENFCVLVFQFESMEFLYLKRVATEEPFIMDNRRVSVILVDSIAHYEQNKLGV